MRYQLHIIRNNTIKLFSVVLVGLVAVLTFVFISPAVTSGYVGPLTKMSDQPQTQNDTGVIILEGATVIDGTGALPKPNTTIVINGSRIAYLFSNDATNNSDLNFSTSFVIDLTGRNIIPGLFDMHAHVANVRKNSYDQSESEYMLRMLWI